NIVIGTAGLVNLWFNRQDWLTYMIGLICVSGLLLLILLLSKGRAMGGGDVKLMAAAGLLLGWQNVILAFACGCILGSVIHLVLMKIQGKERMLAFGPYLSAGIWFSMMWGQELIQWYINQF
ncbi:A24 family peptidase, partial [[Clostridium] symbiosum]